VWTQPRNDLNGFLTACSELLAQRALSREQATWLKGKKLEEAAIKLLMIHARAGRYPADFTQKVQAHLSAIKSEPHLGTWSPWKNGGVPHDITALAAWFNPEDPSYLRERLEAKKVGAGPFAWQEAADPAKPPPRPWLVSEASALERLAALTSLTPEEQARNTWLTEEAKKPRQPRLNQDFQLGSFTYNVKSVEVAESVGSGFAAKRAEEGVRFVLVKYAIRNDGDSTQTVLADDFRIVDAKGREFSPSSDANTALAMSGGNKDVLVSELQPGIKKNTVTAFELPEDAATGTFTLVIPEKGLLGAGSVRITLK
jgi:hypothetical protein